MDHVKEEQNNIYYITVRQLERAMWNNEIGLVSYFVLFFGYISRPWLAGEQCFGLCEGRAWTAHTASVSRECFQYSLLSVLGHSFLQNSLECESSLIVVFPACLSVRVTRTSSYQAMTAHLHFAVLTHMFIDPQLVV